MRLAAVRPFPIEKLSPTSLALFAGCPEQFRQRYLLKRPDVSFGDRFMGSVNHETISYLLNIKREAPTTLDALATEEMRAFAREVYRDAWEAKLEEQGEPDWRFDDPVEMYGRGIMMALTYIEQAMPSINPVAIEQEITIKIPGIPLVRGYVDVIEADKIRERKTTRAKETKPKSKWRFQARVYQFITGLPVEWDVLTRQVEPKLYTAEEYPELRLGMVSRKNTETMIHDLYWRMNDLWQRRGPAVTWPLDGFHDPWLCSYCPIGPKYGATCGSWN